MGFRDGELDDIIIHMNEEVLNQYNLIGQDYIDGQSTVFNGKEDWGRQKLEEFYGDISGKVIIDAGCGHGIDTKIYIESGAKVILSFDPSPFMLDFAKNQITDSSVDFKLGKYESIPFSDMCADILVGRFSLHYVKNLDDAYREIHRVLKTGGRMSFLVPHPIDDFSRKQSKEEEQEVVCISLYDGKVIVKYPTHSFSDYFSEYFLRNFTLDGFAEFAPDEMDKKAHQTAFVFSATKK